MNTPCLKLRFGSVTGPAICIWSLLLSSWWHFSSLSLVLLQHHKDVCREMNSSSKVPLVKENRWRISCWGLPAEAQIQGVWNWLVKLLFSELSTETTCAASRSNRTWGNTLNIDDVARSRSTLFEHPACQYPCFNVISSLGPDSWRKGLWMGESSSRSLPTLPLHLPSLPDLFPDINAQVHTCRNYFICHPGFLSSCESVF